MIVLHFIDFKKRTLLYKKLHEMLNWFNVMPAELLLMKYLKSCVLIMNTDYLLLNYMSIKNIS